MRTNEGWNEAMEAKKHVARKQDGDGEWDDSKVQHHGPGVTGMV